MEKQAATVIWKRRYDEAAHRRNIQRFWMFYAAPAALVVVAAALLSGGGAAAGWLVLLGLFGAMVFVWVWLTGRNERTNPTVSLEAGDLCWANRRAPVDQVRSFSTYMTSVSAPTAGVTARASLGAARFLLLDGNEVQFLWPALDEQQLAELRAALEVILPGRWRSIDTLRDAT